MHGWNKYTLHFFFSFSLIVGSFAVFIKATLAETATGVGSDSDVLWPWNWPSLPLPVALCSLVSVSSVCHQFSSCRHGNGDRDYRHLWTGRLTCTGLKKHVRLIGGHIWLTYFHDLFQENKVFFNNLFEQKPILHSTSQKSSFSNRILSSASY